MNKKQRRSKVKKTASRMPNWVVDVAANKAGHPGERAAYKRRGNTFGAASEVRIIDPATFSHTENSK